MSQIQPGPIGQQEFGVGSSVPDFNAETYRLLRDDWKAQGVTVFSQEIFALMQLLQNFQSSGTQTINQSGTTPAQTITQPFNIPPNSPGIFLQSTPIPPQSQAVTPSLWQTPSLPPFTIQPPQTLALTPAGILQNGQPIGGGGGGGLPGVVLSGSGNTYQVQLAGPPVTTVSVRQLQIDPTAQIPAGTGVIVTQVGTAYVMQVPVWL